MSFDNYSSSYTRPGDGYTSIPTLRVGEQLNPNDATAYPSSMNLVAQVMEAQKSVARIEAVKGTASDGSPTGSVGSGFVVTADGEIATGYHVVKGASDIRVKLGNNTYHASIDAVDQRTDLALLRLTDAFGQRFQPVNLAPSSQMEQGAATIALGFPAGEQKMYMSAGGFSWAPGGFQGYRRFGDIVGSLKGGLMPGEDPNRVALESAMNADQGISGGPMFNSRFQVVGVMDIGTTTGTKGDATPVEDLQRLLSTTRRVNVATNTGSQWGLNLRSEMPSNANNLYQPPPGYDFQPTYTASNFQPTYAASNYYAQGAQNARSEVYRTSTYSAPPEQVAATWDSLARILDRR
ncbi:MAG: trypsin-like peptidase domain-containing protein [Cyanobacteria bacterium SZAS-4]|nr:trypsin-like peptidase domain-containing protein [Cyanobacteria bacterium SZAS-4]